MEKLVFHKFAGREPLLEQRFIIEDLVVWVRVPAASPRHANQEPAARPKDTPYLAQDGAWLGNMLKDVVHQH